MSQTRQDGATKPRLRVPLQGRYVGPLEPSYDSAFECALPPEIRAELQEESPPRFYLREAPPTFRAAPRLRLQWCSDPLHRFRHHLYPLDLKPLRRRSSRPLGTDQESGCC
jgi:hypothetical protein